jgi:murein DD-endopeptidase MepM/ murein hydrolase activator NlpD
VAERPEPSVIPEGDLAPDVAARAREGGGLTIQVLPEGNGRARTWVLSARRLRLLRRLGWAGVSALSVLFLLAVFGVTQAFRLQVVERELALVVEERDQLLRVEATLIEIEAAYRQLQTILGVGAPRAGTWLPRPGGGGSTTASSRAEEPGVPSLWPLTERGFLTRLILPDEGGGDLEHPGIDIAIPSGSYIRAAGSGTVLETGEDPVYGLFVRLEHSNGLETLYAHASAVVTEAGRAVRAGEVIAFVGSSGRSSAPHLHFEVRRDGVPVDPLTFVSRP